MTGSWRKQFVHVRSAGALQRLQGLRVEVERTVAVRDERDPAAVGRPGREGVAEWVVRQIERAGAVGRGDVDLELAVTVGDERQPGAVGGVGRVVVESGAARSGAPGRCRRAGRPRVPGRPIGRWRRRSSGRRATSRGGRRARGSGSGERDRCRRPRPCRSPGCPRGSS